MKVPAAFTSERISIMSSSETIPCISPEHYKATMRGVATAVAVITANCNGRRNGLTATAVCSVSAEPAHLLVCVNRSATAEAMIRESGRFAVSYLQRSHQEVSRRFSQSKLDDATRFAAGDWKATASGIHVLADAIAYFVCEVVSQETVGTHSVFIGCVTEAQSMDGDPLVYCGGSYSHLTAD